MAVDLRGRDFLAVSDLDRSELAAVLDLAARIKAGQWTGQPLSGKHFCLLFQRPSHRTRMSFEVGIGRLGGRSTMLTEVEVQFGVREPVEDAARVLDRYVDGVAARMRSHVDLVALAQASSRPVINALTDKGHPCQILADLLTIEEQLGGLDGRRVTYIGDGNNVAQSLMEASTLLGFQLAVVTPPGHEPVMQVPGVVISSDLAVVDGSEVVYTDVWASMGSESERQARAQEFAEYQVNQALMAHAPGAIFMHCLPAHRGEEVTDEVIEGPQSRVFDQAENRLYAQMALMALIFA
jgi:ornithine carbamoyltransferase